MTALDVAGQLLAIGGEQVAVAAGWTLLWALAAVFGIGCVLAAWWLLSWRKELLRTYREQHPSPALDAAVQRHPAGSRLVRYDDVSDVIDQWTAEWREQQGDNR